jgi:predicted nucleotidyltransferase
MLKIHPARPLPHETAVILASVAKVAQTSGIEYLLIGATARDIMLEHVFGITSLRATRDVDFALAIRNWAEFSQIKNDLAALGKFSADKVREHRLYYDAARFGASRPIDLIPCGAIEGPGHEISWPPDMSMVMSVAGYSDAMKSAVPVDAGSGIIVRVASLPGLACMKIFAWAARRHENKKDAEDLHFILANYGDAGNADRLYEEPYFDLLRNAGYNVALAGSTLLGYDAACMLGADSIRTIKSILEDPLQRNQLEHDMNRRAVQELSGRLLAAFAAGLAM